MGSEETLTALEVAELLKITKNTVYELVKRGELPAYKVGKKLRIDKIDVDNYINSQKRPKHNRINDIEIINNSSNSISNTEINNNINKAKVELSSERDIVISGQDVILDILAQYIEKNVDDVRVLRSNLGSYNSLYELYMEKVSISSVHLWDGDSNEYNEAFVRKLLPGIPCILINLAYRTQGFYVAKGNPHNIKSWKDLSNKDISIINREKGSGTRVLLDEKLRLYNINSESIRGYDIERSSHLSVASSIARGEGDVGMGIEKVALQVGGIDFIPIQKERYDIVIKKSSLKSSVYKSIIEIIKSTAFKKELEGLGGYDLKDIGKILATT